MHAEVNLCIEMPVIEVEGFTPEAESLLLLPPVEGYDTPLVVDIPLFPCVWLLHFVKGALEEFLVLSDQQFTNVLQLAFTVSGRIDVDAFD